MHFRFFCRYRKCYSPLAAWQSVFFSPPHRFILFATPPAVFSGCSPAAPFCTSRLGSPCFPPRRFAHSRAKVFVPAFRDCRVRRAVLTFPLLRSAFYVSFAEDVYCCKKCGKKGRRKNTAPNGLPVIDIVMFHHCPFTAAAMPLIFSFGKCKLFSSGKTHRSFVRFAFPRFSFALSPLFF